MYTDFMLLPERSPFTDVVQTDVFSDLRKIRNEVHARYVSSLRIFILIRKCDYFVQDRCL